MKIPLIKIGLFIVSSMLMVSCAVGPDFHSPPSPHPKSYTEKTMPKKTVNTPGAGKAGQAQTFLKGADIPKEWWYVFHSRALNRLICKGLANSPNIAAAYAALRAAKETLYAQIGSSFLPAITSGLSGSRQRNSAITVGIPDQSDIFEVYNATINASYTLDIFGGLRRQTEALKAQVDYQQFQLLAAQLTVATNIVTTVVTAAAYEDQIRASKALLRAQAGQLKIMYQQFNLGGISKATVLTQQTLVEQTRATIPGLEKNLAIQRHALSTLVGQLPNEPLPHIKLDSLTLPKTLPVSLSSCLVRQRPDVRAAEALLQYASAQIGVATANMLPVINLTANYGWLAELPSKLFTAQSNVWGFGGAIAQPIFQGGALFALRRKAIDLYQQACGQYRQTVLTAFQNVADVLRALETDARNLRDQKSAEKAAKENLVLAEDQYRLGGADYLSLLNAQRQYQNIVLAVIQAKALRYNDTAALFQSLGGGWWHETLCVRECLNAT